ncbi:MAG: hypothetical protein NWT08_12360 [Akkermansiaceae bacterium]|jgi:hypothetical protein|nr:hypothetical protein [Akkermansiaceae bacterium]MDP4646882.1 hypothetical protein [Akkermansiaceae bacterium]MDP4721542.1 hypothetical protein [Akkermansiaceae bacterium]MDP4781213.1 hypothetical protein [Akkermansiaceae bacterium]MDP4847911.1 hypothetical protein [Akkermansiaceae bacterium]
MKATTPERLKKTVGMSGFALIVTLTLMVLLLILALGLLSLSQVSLRSAGGSSPGQIARANARMAMMLAIGELQKTAGPDTRVTASAEAVAGVNGSRYVTGVWRSWEGNDHDKTTGKPLAPLYGTKLDRGELEIDSADTGRFLGWLVSGPEKDNEADDPPSVTVGDLTVPLVAEGTLGSGTDAEVHVQPDTTEGGSYAWWIQGENTKVQLKPSESPASDFESTEQLVVSPGPSGTAFGIENTSSVDRAATRGTLDFVASGASGSGTPSEYFHDLTVSAKGLLTNNANGGWKRDLSIFSEEFASIPEGFPSFTLSPGQVHTSGKSNQNSPSNPLIYGWSNWSKAPFQNSVSWAGLVDYATLYKQQLSSGNPVASFTDSTSYQRNDGNQQWELGDTARCMPVLARIHTVISLSAKKIDETTYQPSVVLNPVVTMWNPYDVAIDMSWRGNFRLNLIMGCPFSVRFKLDTIERVRSPNDVGLQTITIPTGTPSSIWLPGEVRTFSPTGGVVVADESNRLNYTVGCDPSGGVRYNIPGFSNGPGATTLSATEALLQEIFNGPNVQGTGVYYTLKRASTRIGNPPNTNNMSLLLDSLENAKDNLGENIPLTGVSGTLESLSAANGAKPFLSVVTTMRFARDVNDRMNDITTNGIHHMNPAGGYMVGANDDQNATPLGERFDPYPYGVLIYSVNSYTDPSMPSGLVGDPEGYLGSGFRAEDGLSNLVLLDVPTRPLRTIGDLQHFNINKNNHWAPYTLNALGNSRASAFIDSDKIQVSGAGSSSVVGHDHSYASNHIFLDDWFVSSVAPDVGDWSATEVRDIEQVYSDHLSKEEGLPKLPNHYYKPLNLPDDPDSASAAFLSDSDAWLKIAAELEVEGMFNINSTSELAWAMLLKRNFGADEGGVLTLDDAVAGSGSATTSPELSGGSPFPRNTLGSANDGGGFASLSQHLRFDDVQINALAREIVFEIKKRGPFLSLSEFFNRQLSDEVALAKSGAVESALHRLSEGIAAENPYADLQSDFGDQPSTTNARGGALTWPFPDAAEGNMAYGFPGWTRQADVLRSVSGILSARDDTFTIRAYGDARDDNGNILSKAWCEVVVQRTAEYVDDTGDNKYTLPAANTLQSEANKLFGRRFKVVQFRWLNPDEV